MYIVPFWNDIYCDVKNDGWYQCLPIRPFVWESQENYAVTTIGVKPMKHQPEVPLKKKVWNYERSSGPL